MLSAIDAGRLSIRTPHVCAGRDHPNREPSPIYLFVEVCPVVLGVALADADRAADLVCGIIRISTCDAVHAAVMLNNDVECIASFDAGFDQIAGLRRRVKLS